ncbi:hypothetical protein B0H14DRAFT_2560613 [Mycena olivaceomarginata]|nr:hypothetical protein B0H14DRAFT_2560613 [Mycena olivaceomarginata]
MLKSSASMPGPISALTVLVLAATILTVQATPWQPTIRGCTAQITSNGDVFKLVGTDTFSQFIQCKTSQLHTVSLPEHPDPVDSNPNCPTTCPLAGTYLIKTSLELPEGAFNGSIMFQGNKCIDVKDGVNTNGVRLQTWTCVDGAANQQFLHRGGSVVTLPTEFIGWYLHQGLCMDLTDGINVSGNPVQMWACDFQNPNQIWQLEPSSQIHIDISLWSSSRLRVWNHWCDDTLTPPPRGARAPFQDLGHFIPPEVFAAKGSGADVERTLSIEGFSRASLEVATGMISSRCVDIPDSSMLRRIQKPTMARIPPKGTQGDEF